jgi:hypothetical protein
LQGLVELLFLPYFPSQKRMTPYGCSYKRTSVACAVGPSVTKSSADFSFRNLIFCGKLSKDTKNMI